MLRNHSADEKDLLRILLTKNCDVWLHQVKQTGDDGEHAIKVARACSTLKAVADGPGIELANRTRVTSRVDVCDGWREYGISQSFECR